MKADERILRLSQAAHDAGCDRDQVRRFITAGYWSLPWALRFHAAASAAYRIDGAYWILTGGARGPGKSHSALAQVCLDDCQRVPGLKFLFLRKTKLSAKESFDDLVYKTLRGIQYEYKQGQITLANGSRVVVGGYNNAGDIDKYLSIEYDGAIVEELTQLTEDKVTKVRGSVRTAKPDWRPRVYATTNPGGVGHSMVLEHFVKPYDSGETNHRFLGGKTLFIPATYRDNPFLDQDYIDYLVAIPGQLGKAWRDGDFYVFSGMAFPSWDEMAHVIQPFDIPANWLRICGIDDGYNPDPWACVWLAKDPESGHVYMYREQKENNLTTMQQAERINDLNGLYKPQIYYCDPSMFTKSNMLGRVMSPADEYQQAGITLQPADNKRIPGKRRVENLLSLAPDGKPHLQVFSSCPNFIRDIASLPLNTVGNLEDVDTNADDHLYDALKYSSTNLARQAVQPTRQQETAPLQRLAAHGSMF